MRYCFYGIATLLSFLTRKQKEDAGEARFRISDRELDDGAVRIVISYCDCTAMGFGNKCAEF
jgi:hypothetical protein